jgi:hypothetical protein
MDPFVTRRCEPRCAIDAIGIRDDGPKHVPGRVKDSAELRLVATCHRR